MDSLKRKNYPLYFLLPGLVIFMVFFIVPFFVAIYYSFTNWDFVNANFVGIRNYKNIIMDPEMNIAFKNTFAFAIVTSVGKLVLGMILAVFLNRKFRLTNYLRTVYFLPFALNLIAVGVAFKAIMHPEKGILNVVLQGGGVDFLAQNWLTDPKIALLSVCAIDIWKGTGYIMLILLAGMQNTSKDYYEAAEIDGATGWQEFWKITFPLIRPSFNNALLLNVITGLKVFDMIISTTNGGPGVTTQVFNTVIYRSYSLNRQGEACAGTIVLAAIVFVITMITYGIVAKKEVEL